MGMNPLSLAGLLILLIGILLLVFGIRAMSGLRGKAETRFGGVVLLGPIPLLFGDKRLAGMLALISLIIIAALLLLGMLYG